MKEGKAILADIFYLENLGCGRLDGGRSCFFKALMPLGQKETGKCVALNSQKKLSFKTLNKEFPLPDTIFLIIKAEV